VASALKVAEQGENLHILTVLPDTQERYMTSPLYDQIDAEMNEAEKELSRSTPGAQIA
jgi:cysteine synthase A